MQNVDFMRLKVNEFVSRYTGYKPNNVCPTMYVSPRSLLWRRALQCPSVSLHVCSWFCPSGFNGVSEGATVTDADRSATPLFITESARISCSLHTNPDILEDDSQCISFTLQFVPERHVHQVVVRRNGYRPEQIHLLLAES